jgi:hypothetical protein
MAEKREMPVKIPDNVIGGVYANQMLIGHTREEFLLDFINLFPPQGVVNARVIVSPGHLKRMIRALAENLKKYEDLHGEVKEAPVPGKDQFIN